ncbi:ABC transporter ATP-binding protein [Planctomycetota bacterium]
MKQLPKKRSHVRQTTSAIQDKPRSRPIVIECRHLTKTFGGPLTRRDRLVHALKDISLCVHRGQIVGLIGPNGAGKSTLLNLIAGLVLPTRGRVTICGHRARSTGARRHLGYMPEHPVFPGQYSARAVLRYHAALLGLPAETGQQQMADVISNLHMAEWIERPAAEFSQGMKQRLALGIAMLGAPDLLLLDEPSNGLDPLGIVQLRKVLKRLGDKGTTIVISSHRLGELEKLTSDYLFMYQGQVLPIADGMVAQGVQRLRVELVSQGRVLARSGLPDISIVRAEDTELLIAIPERDAVPDVVRRLVHAGAAIRSVTLQGEDIEELFVQLYREGRQPCAPMS